MYRFLLCSVLVACATPEDLDVDTNASSLPSVQRVADGPKDLPVDADFTGPQDPVGPAVYDASGARRALSRRSVDEMSTELVVAQRTDSGWVERVLNSDGNPDRVGISSSGEHVAFCSAASGFASLYVQPFAGGEAIQLTNIGLVQEKRGGPPQGWTPPPTTDDVRFDRDFVVWTAEDGEHKAAWR